MNGERPEESRRRPERPEDPGRAAARARIAQQQTWVDLRVKRAMERGEFDDLPGAGKPLPDLGVAHDPDWWVKQLVERERIVVLPPSVALRKEDAELDDRLDRLASEREVRAAVEDFNERVLAARYRLPEGPPLVTMPREVEQAVAAWRERRTARRAARAAARTDASPTAEGDRPRRRWWRRR